MGHQIYICLILCFFWSVMVSFVFYYERAPTETQILFLKKNIFLKYVLFSGRFITFTTLTFAAFCLLSVIHKQWSKIRPKFSDIHIFQGIILYP